VIELTHALSTLARIRDISGRYRSDNRATAPLTSEAHATRAPVASLEDWMTQAETPAAATKHSKMKAA
jgi:hypothetical protein